MTGLRYMSIAKSVTQPTPQIYSGSHSNLASRIHKDKPKSQPQIHMTHRICYQTPQDSPKSPKLMDAIRKPNQYLAFGFVVVV